MADPPLLVRNLAAHYGERQVLADVDLTVQPGEVRVILGGSGGGKTTLLKHLIGLARPTSGFVRLLGCDFATADEPERQAILRRIGMLFQGGALINALTLVDNVALPLRELPGTEALPPSVVDDVARMKLAQVGLEHAAALTPPELSGGMKKRAALARAMVLDPDILFCDEPSAGLDPVTAADLDALILRLRDEFGMAVVVVTHELASIAAIADQVIMLAGGRVIADGPYNEVERMDHPAVRAFFDRAGTHAHAQKQSLLDVLEPKGPR